MKSAIVIKTMGDPETCDAIVSGMTRQIIPYNSKEMAEIRAEVARLKAKDEIRACGDVQRLENARIDMAEKYMPVYHGALYWAILRGWALVWYGLYCVYDMLDSIDWRG